MAENDAASQAVLRPLGEKFCIWKRPVFVFRVLDRDQEHGQDRRGKVTQAGTHPTMHGVYPLHRLLEDGSMKSYGEEKTHRNSTNNIHAIVY